MNEIVFVLGTQYQIVIGNQEEYPCLADCDGYMDSSVHKIVISDMQGDDHEQFSKEDIEAYQKQVCRHEIIHAFLHESGLSGCTSIAVSWAMHEEMVYWMAIQFPKIHRAFLEAGAYG